MLDEWRRCHRLHPVTLPPEIADGFYRGYANATVWPLLHGFVSRVRVRAGAWEAYVEANRRFCEAVVAVAEDGDAVWVHDYHLMLLPAMLRAARPRLRIGFFLHVPFPPAEVFATLARRQELLDGILAADLAGFHTHAHLQNFRAAVTRTLGHGSDLDRVLLGRRTCRLGVFPAGIAPEEPAAGRRRPDEAVAARVAELRRTLGGARMLLAVDRLDYTKGIPERLRAYRRLLEDNPPLRGRVVLTQVAVPSREGVGAYRDLGAEVSGLVGDINGAFGTPAWTPIVYLRRALSKTELLALYAAADVGWVTPLRDGMNLVAKEYVASQARGEGVLVLSEFAGAAEELPEALVVNPYDEEAMARAVEAALAMPAAERGARMQSMRARVLRHHAGEWAEGFLQALGAGGPAAANADAMPVEALCREFRDARGRLLLLDYDGTLVPLAASPELAAPPAGLLARLAVLATSKATRVAIVSGRGREDLERWFGGIPGLWLAAEHGAFVWRPDTRSWQCVRPEATDEWKAAVRRVLDHASARMPGSVIEDKEHALVLHYPGAAWAEPFARRLRGTLTELLADTQLRAIPGHRSIEVRPAWANKGAVIARLDPGLSTDFRLALGDDRTDEELFGGLPDGAWTVHVGAGPSAARYRLPDPEAVGLVLSRLTGGTAES